MSNDSDVILEDDEQKVTVRGKLGVSFDFGDVMPTLPPMMNDGMVKETALVDPQTGTLRIGEGNVKSYGFPGTLDARDGNGMTVGKLDGREARMTLGGIGRSGDLVLTSREGPTDDSTPVDTEKVADAVEKAGKSGESVTLDDSVSGLGDFSFDGLQTALDDVAGKSGDGESSGEKSWPVTDGGTVSVGNFSLDHIVPKPRVHVDSGEDGPLNDETVRAYVSGATGDLRLGGDGEGGTVTVRDADGTPTGHVRGEDGELVFGATGDDPDGSQLRWNPTDGTFTISDQNGNPAFRVEADGTVKTRESIQEGAL